MRVRVLLLSGAVFLGGMCASAQMSAPAGTPAPMKDSPVAPAKALDDLLSFYQGEVLGLAKAMPAEKYGFAPAQGMFAPGQTVQFDTVRTFLAQVIHLTQGNYMFFSAVGGMKPAINVDALSKITTKDDALAAFQASFVFAHQAITHVTAANAFTYVGNIDGMTTRATIAGFAVAHGFDHYGQMVEYARMNGIVPPASLPSKP